MVRGDVRSIYSSPRPHWRTLLQTAALALIFALPHCRTLPRSALPLIHLNPLACLLWWIQVDSAIYNTYTAQSTRTLRLNLLTGTFNSMSHHKMN